MSGTSHVSQVPSRPQLARPVSYPIDYDTFQWSDPPAAMRSPQKELRRDTSIVTVSAICSVIATTDSSFEVLVLDRTDSTEVDILSGRGVFPATADEVSLFPVVELELIARRHRIVVNLVTVGTGLTGFIVTVVYQ